MLLGAQIVEAAGHHIVDGIKIVSKLGTLKYFLRFLDSEVWKCLLLILLVNE